MSYPPQYGYPPPPGRPPAGYPPPQGYQPPPPGHYPRYGYPPQAPAPPQPPPPPAAPPPRRRASAGKMIQRVSLILLLPVFGFIGYAVLMESSPEVGDCLTSLERQLVGGYEVVECDDPAASYEIVNRTERTSSSEYEICEGYSEGVRLQSTGRRGKVYWTVCANPLN